MADYNKSTNFAVKDTLVSGDPNKIVSGAEVDNEFNNISSMSTTKADKAPTPIENNVAALTSNGSVKDAGFTSSSVVLNSRQVNTGTGLTGGGNLTENRTLQIDEASTAEAQAGTSSTKVMTPRRVADVIAVRAMPVGSTYIQFPGRAAPNTLFGGTWSAIFDNEGIFFRTPGGEASSFGGGIQGDAIREIQGTVDLGATNPGTGAQTGVFRKSFVNINERGGNNIGTRLTFAASRVVPTANENRPRNRTVRVWVRTS